MVPTAASQTSFLSLSFPVVVQYFVMMPNGEVHTILATASAITDLGYRHYLPLKLTFGVFIYIEKSCKNLKNNPKSINNSLISPYDSERLRLTTREQIHFEFQDG